MVKMNRQYIEVFLDKLVEIKLFDGKIIRGYLHKTGEEIFKNDPNLYIPRKYYVLLDGYNNDIYNLVFRSSHIKKIKNISAMKFNYSFKLGENNE